MTAAVVLRACALADRLGYVEALRALRDHGGGLGRLLVAPVMALFVLDRAQGLVGSWLWESMSGDGEPDLLRGVVAGHVAYLFALGRAWVAGAVVVAWIGVVTGVRPGGWLAALRPDGVAWRAFGLTLLIGVPMVVLEQLLLVLPWLFGWGDALGGVMGIRVGPIGLGALLLDLLPWFPVLPLTIGYVALVRGEPFEPLAWRARLRGRWWRTACILLVPMAVMALPFDAWRFAASYLSLLGLDGNLASEIEGGVRNVLWLLRFAAVVVALTRRLATGARGVSR